MGKYFGYKVLITMIFENVYLPILDIGKCVYVNFFLGKFYKNTIYISNNVVFI